MKLTDTLDELTTIIGQNAVRTDLGPRLIKKLCDIENRLLSIKVELVALEGYVKLHTEAAQEEPCISADQLADLPIDELIDSSALMGALYRAGINIDRHTVFSVEETKLAALIAENYANYSAILRNFRQAYKSTKSKLWTMSFSGGPSVFSFMNLLDKNNVIQVKKILLRKETHWVPHKFEYLKNATAKQNLRVVFSIKNQGLYDFFRGDWMTAFTSQIITDHLNRNRIPHETFAKVAYRAPVDLMSARSDFDVITSFENRVLCFECKSGVIRDSESLEIAAKSGDIKKVLTQFLSNELLFKFFLIFDGELNDKEIIVGRFAKQGITALEIREVRKMIFDTIASKDDEAKSVLVLT